MKRLILTMLSGYALLSPLPAMAANLTVFCASNARDMELCRTESQAWAQQSGNTVTLVSLPADWITILPLYRQVLAAPSAAADVLVIDGTWLGSLAPRLGTLEAQQDDEDLAPAPFFSNGRRVALPWYRDIGLLFYRQDLLDKYHLPVPATWDDLTREARFIQETERAHDTPNLWGYVWQGRTGESLICNALEWFGTTGGTLVAENGTVSLDNDAARQALARAANWLGTLSPPTVLLDDEEATRGAFQTGHAVFMRNWVYAWALTNAPDSPVAGRVGVGPLPRTTPADPPRGVDGTVYLGMARNTPHPAEARAFIHYLTSPAVERQRAITGAYIPARQSLLDDEAVKATLPLIPLIREALDHPVLRPVAATGVDYPQLAWRVENGFHDILRKQISPAEGLHTLSLILNNMALRGAWQANARHQPFPVENRQ